MSNAFSLYLKPRLLAILALGFASGLPLALTASTLSVRLMEAGVSKAAIGLFAAIATPYALKFLWSPLADGAPFPLLTRLLGQRRGWLVGTQLLLMLAIIALGFADPAIDPWRTAAFALLVAIASATQDIVIDATRVELLSPAQQGNGAAMAVLGYRLGMIASSAGALYLASYTSWRMTYILMALLVGVGMAAALLIQEPSIQEEENASPSAPRRFPDWLRAHVRAPLVDFMRRPHWIAIALFIVLYKFADAFLGVMTNPFLIEIGFTKEQIASIVKFYGLIATIAGSFIGGAMVYRLGAIRSLWIGGLLHAATNVMFVLQARMGADASLLALGITLENVSGGIGTAAFVAYLSALCNVHYTATQYALLSSLAAMGRTWLSTPAGWVAEALGWQGFFLLASALAIPGLVLLYYINANAPGAGSSDA